MRVKSTSENPKYLTPYKLKPQEFPEGFVLVQDTREQQSPLLTRLPNGLVLMSATLTDGDYSVRGFEDKIAFERKRISELPGYCVTDREKTVKKMDRFARMDFVGLIIEGKESDAYRFQQYSKVHPEVIRGALTSFNVRYGVHVYFGDKDNVTRWMLDRAVKFWKIMKGV